MKKVALSLTLVASLLSGCQHLGIGNQRVSNQEISNQPSVKAELFSTKDNTPMGVVNFYQTHNGVNTIGTVTGLDNNQTYAIHLHENALCSNDGKDAGGHFNPFNQPHGHPNTPQSHAGGMPNITTNNVGVAKVNFLNPKISLDSNKVNYIVGRTVVVHAKADDYTSQPAGDAGARIVCGVIRP